MASTTTTAKNEIISSENKLNFSWERFKEEDFNKKKNELLNKKEWNGPALIDVGAVNIELHDPEYSSAGGEPRVFLDYYIGGDTSEPTYSYGTDIPYGHADGSSIPISKFISSSYEEFKSYLENEVTSEFERINNAENKILLEAERPTVNFDDRRQGAELYITKLAEKIDFAEDKDRRTWQFVRDNHPGYHDGDGIASDKIFSDNDVYKSVVNGAMSVESAEKYVELRGTKVDFAREFIRTEKEILDNAIENWQLEEADKNGDQTSNVPSYIQEVYDTVNDAYFQMNKAIDIINFENEKDNFLKSFSGCEFNTTIDIDGKEYDQYFIYPEENLPGIIMDNDTYQRLVVDIDRESKELLGISIDRKNNLTGELDCDVQVELSNEGKKILHAAEKEIKKYLLREVEKHNKQSKNFDTQKTNLSINDLNKIKNELITQTRSNAINSKEDFSIEKAAKLSGAINSIESKQFAIPKNGIDLQIYNIYKNRPDGWRKYVIDWATNKLPIVDDSSVGSVNYSRSAVRDAVGHIKNKGDLKLITLPYVNELIKNGVMFYEYEDKKRNCSFFNYAHPIRFNGEEFIARLAVRQDRNGNRFYTNEFSEIMKKDGLSIDTGSPELTRDNLTHLSSKIVLQEILNVKDRAKENLEKLFDGKYSIDDGNSPMSFRETLDFYNNEDADRTYNERLNHAVSRMLYYSLYLPDDEAGEKRWKICDSIAEKITGGEISQLFDGINSAQEIADKEAKEKFGYSWQDKTNSLSDLLDAPGEVTDPNGHPTDLDHMIHYFEENTPLEGHRTNLEKAVSHMLMFTIDDFRSLSPENYDNITQDGAAAEVRGELCDRIANDLVSGKINNDWIEINKEVETYSKELADREIEKLKEDGKTKELNVKAFGLKNTVSQKQNLSNQQLQEENMTEQSTIHVFTDDKKKMSDFNELTKREFLELHSDVNESEYDATVAELKKKDEYTIPWNSIKEILGTGGKAFANELQYQRELHQYDNYTNDADGNFMRKFDAMYFAAEQNLSHRGLDMDTYRDLFGAISEETATEIENSKRHILGLVVEKFIKGISDFKDFIDIQQAYDRALGQRKPYLKYTQAELTEAIGKQDNLFVNNIADYLNSVMRHYYEKRETAIAGIPKTILNEALFTAETELNTEAFKTLLENGADITYRKTEIINGKEHKANILHYIAADDNIEALSLLMDDNPYGKPFNRLTAGQKLSLLRELNFEGRTPLEVSENYYREEPSRYEPDMIMPDVMRELAYQEENLMSHVPPLILTDKFTGNILMIEQAAGDGCEINLFDKNKKLVDHDISAGYTNNLGESVDYKSNLEAARVSMVEYEKQNLWGHFYEYEKLPATVNQIQALRNSRDNFFKTLDAFDKKLNPKLSEINKESAFSPATAKFTTLISKEVFDKLGIDTEENEDFYRLEISLTKDGKLKDWYLDAGSAMAGVGENIDADFSEEEKKKFNFIFEKVNDVIREKYPSIEKLIDLEEKGSRTVTQSVTFPARFINAEKQSLSLLEKLQDKYGFGENDFEKFINDGDVDIHFAAPVPKEFQFPKSKTDEWIKAVCKDLKENFGAIDVEDGMDGSEMTEKVFDTAEEAEKFVAEKTERKTYHILKESDVKDFEIVSDENFSDIVNRETAFSEERNTIAAAGVAPTIQTLRTRASSTALRASATTLNESITPQSENSSEVQFKDFVKEVEAEYKDLRLFRKATVNVLKRLPPAQKAAIKSELLKRGANNPESLALVMKNEVKKQHSQKKNPEQNRNRNAYEPER